MNCDDALKHLYEFLDRELTPELEAEIRHHLEACRPCEDCFDFEEAFLRFLQARCRSRGAPPELKHKILSELFGE